jgi:hypothetical protein
MIVALNLNFPCWSTCTPRGGLKEIWSNVKTTISPGAQPLPFRVTGTDVPTTAWFGFMLILAVVASAGVALTRKDNNNRMMIHGTARRRLENKRRM